MPNSGKIGLAVFLVSLFAAILVCAAILLAPEQAFSIVAKANRKAVLVLLSCAIIAMLGWFAYMRVQPALPETKMLGRAIRGILAAGTTAIVGPILLAFAGRLHASSAGLLVEVDFQSQIRSSGFSLLLTVIPVVILCFRYRSACRRP